MLFTSHLCSSMVLNVGESFLFLPKHTGISVLQAGGVLALIEEGGTRALRPRSQTLPAAAGSAPPTATAGDPGEVVVCAGQAPASAS